MFSDTLETQRKKNDVGTVANLAGAANTKSRFFAKASEMKTRMDFCQPKAWHKELGQCNLEEVLPRARHVHESGFPDSDPSDVFANPATQSQFGILHCPPLTS